MRYSPGDLSLELPTLADGDVDAAIERAHRAYDDWRATPLEKRAEALKLAQQAIESDRDALAQGIAVEIGKPLKEAAGEVGAVIAKFDLAIEDATRYLAEERPEGECINPSVIQSHRRF